MSHDSLRTELLLVAQEPESAQRHLEGQGFRVLAVDDCSRALHVVQGHEFDAALVDLDCGDLPQFLQELCETDGALQTIVLTNQSTRDLQTATPGLSVDTFPKSTRWADLTPLIPRAVEVTRLRRENHRLRQLMEHGGASSTSADRDPLTPAIGSPVDLATINRAHVLSVLETHRGNKAQTARALGINRRSLYRLLEKYAEAKHS